jgi:hypothetical protein
MDSAQSTKLDFLFVPATPFSVGVLASVLVLVAVLIGPKVVIDTVLNVSFSVLLFILKERFLIQRHRAICLLFIGFQLQTRRSTCRVRRTHFPMGRW